MVSQYNQHTIIMNRLTSSANHGFNLMLTLNISQNQLYIVQNVVMYRTCTMS